MLFGENAVFLQEFSFDDESFRHQSEKEILGVYDSPPSEDGIDLTQFLPVLKNYRQYADQTSFLIFRVFYKNQIFDYYHYAEWFEAFHKLFEKAKQVFSEKMGNMMKISLNGIIMMINCEARIDELN